MRVPWLVSSLLTVTLLPGVACAAAEGPGPPGGASSRTAAPVTPTLVDVRAGHQDGWDRVVFEFSGGVPEQRDVAYVDRLVADGSGLPVRVAGRTVLRVRFERAQAHTDAGVPTAAPRRVAYALRNVMTAVRSGDFEAVTTYGLGVAKRTPFRVRTLQDPDRVVVEVRAAFPTARRRVWFFDRDRFLANREPYFVAVRRPVLPRTPAAGVMDRLYAGPTRGERGRGLRLLRSRSTGWTDLVISDGVARLRLVGGCSSGGSTVTVAGEILPTLHQFPSVGRVVLRDPQGHTLDPDGPGDATPECLEP